MDAVDLIATLSTPLTSTLYEIHSLPLEVAWLQLRADLAGDVPADRLRSHFRGKLLYTLRSSDPAARLSGENRERANQERKTRQVRLLSAAREFDLVELEPDDLVPELLAAIPPQRRLISWHGGPCDGFQLRSIFDRLAATPAHSYCLVPAAAKAGDGLAPLQFLKSLARRDVTAFSQGPAGFWSRLLAPHFGAPFLFAPLARQASRPDELDIQGIDMRQIAEDYGFPAFRPVHELYGIVGNRVLQSASPRLHNAGYRGLNYPAMFVPFQVEDFDGFWREMVESPALASLGLPIRGLTIVSPHKEVALRVAGSRSSTVCKAVSTNIFVCRNGVWEADTTDPESVAGLPGVADSPRRFKAAVVGCGGAGRAVAAALQQSGADVTLVNRGKERGDYAVKLLGLPFVPLSDFAPQGFSLLVNATPVGREDDILPFSMESMSSGTVVVDLAYGRHPTPLVSEARARGGKVVDGHDVVLTQVRKQFQMMLGKEMPPVIGRNLALPGGRNLAVSGAVAERHGLPNAQDPNAQEEDAQYENVHCDARNGNGHNGQARSGAPE